MVQLTRGLGLLESAVSYALASAALATPQRLPMATPCADCGPADRLIAIGDRELTTSMVAVAGAIEIAVHGWDIAAACGVRRPVPADLAAALLPIAPLLITPSTRPGLFADPVPVSRLAAPGDKLAAFLGRQPSLQAPPLPPESRTA